jgi:transcriptional regulator with XRE-family HTH domain
MRGDRLSEIRKDYGYTQQQLAELLSVSKYTISSYENNKTTPDNASLIRMAKIFDVSLDYLLGLTNTRVSYRRDNHGLRVPNDFTNLQLAQVQEYIEYLKFCEKNA